MGRVDGDCILVYSFNLAKYNIRKCVRKNEPWCGSLKVKGFFLNSSMLTKEMGSILVWTRPILELFWHVLGRDRELNKHSSNFETFWSAGFKSALQIVHVQYNEWIVFLYLNISNILIYWNMSIAMDLKLPKNTTCFMRLLFDVCLLCFDFMLDWSVFSHISNSTKLDQCTLPIRLYHGIWHKCFVVQMVFSTRVLLIWQDSHGRSVDTNPFRRQLWHVSWWWHLNLFIRGPQRCVSFCLGR